eukprot:CAMPEP_0119151118 /NCGR_PEP_ID=MMETSP1310-20130426/45880_1 /TAXON_ID=464262 /ORGANISM="Genus nov. species nov., Strain RCC2339" /LENGTH=136 /DNA_ID=CAMNT_0007143367 /DNA_START=8 /DNA_END=415 /DNA_ORIENTATION=+
MVDGSVLEGGGQILRNTVALSAILGLQVEIRRIRRGRAKPGLKAQHQCGIELVSRMAGARLVGCERNSTEVDFDASQGRGLAGGDYIADTKTAGSCTLLAQTSLLPALFATSPCKLDLRGGTDAGMAPPADYLAHV